MANAAASFFSPEIQNEFWGRLDPDIRIFLEGFESREDWTYSYDAFPDMFLEIERVLPRVVEIPPSPETSSLLRQLIPVLAAMPMRQSLAAIAWLDRDVKDPLVIGWGVLCYLEAAEVFRNHPEDPIFLESKNIYDRIQVILKSTLETRLFGPATKFDDVFMETAK